MDRRTPSRENRALQSWPALTDVLSNPLELPSLANLLTDFIDRLVSGGWSGSFQCYPYGFKDQIVNARFR